MFAALHGELLFHPWRDPLVSGSDPYSLLLSRSSAMGCLTEATENASGGIWGMNDADLGPGSTASSSRAAWFQVELTGPVGIDRQLPVQSFHLCAGDAVTHIGTLDLQAAQVLLPVQSRPTSVGLLSSFTSAFWRLLQDAEWFHDCDPARRTQIPVTLEAGNNLDTLPTVPEMLQWMQNINQDVFSYTSYSLTDNQPMILKPGIVDNLWGGPAHH